MKKPVPSLLLPLALLAASLLPACASLDSPPQPGGAILGSAEELQDWQLQGRLNIRTREDATTVNLLWTQADDAYDISLSGSFGLGGVSIRGDDSMLVMERQGEPPYLASNLSQLSADYLGFTFPADHLLFWVRGLAAPDAPAETQRNALGTLSQLEQAGWQVDYDRYQDTTGYLLPGRIQLQNEDYRLTFLVNRWQLASDDDAS